MSIHTLNDATRRRFLLGSVAFVATLAMPGTSLALTDATARSLVDKLVAEINRVIASGKSETAMISDFGVIFGRYADVYTIAKSCLGADARSYSNAQISAYAKAFQNYIAHTYGRRFREFIGGSVKVEGVREVKTWHEVKSTAYLRGRSPMDVRFLVSDRSGRPLFFDMFIEGVSMRLTERTEIQSKLDSVGGDIAKLTQLLSNTR